MSTIFKWTRPVVSSVSSALLCIHFVGEHIVGHGACDGEVEPCQQLLERLMFSAAEHGDALPAFAGLSNLSSSKLRSSSVLRQSRRVATLSEMLVSVGHLFIPR